MEFLELVQKRHSVRSFLDKPVEQSVLLSILEAGSLAPSACNIQPWIFIVVQDAIDREKLKPVYDRPWFLEAPVILAVCCDHSISWKRKDGKDYGDIDIAIAMDHITLAAAEKEIGTCWIGSFNELEARKVLRLPSQIEPVAFTPMGYPATNSFTKVRKSLPECLHWGYYGGKKNNS